MACTPFCCLLGFGVVSSFTSHHEGIGSHWGMWPKQFRFAWQQRNRDPGLSSISSMLSWNWEKKSHIYRSVCNPLFINLLTDKTWLHTRGKWNERGHYTGSSRENYILHLLLHFLFVLLYGALFSIWINSLKNQGLCAWMISRRIAFCSVLLYNRKHDIARRIEVCIKPVCTPSTACTLQYWVYCLYPLTSCLRFTT